jgi:type VI protein secretion system component VasA
MNTITDELLDMAEPLRPLLHTSADWRAVRMYARAVLARAESKQDAALEAAAKRRAVQIVEWHRNDYNRQQIDPIVAELRNGL